MLRPTFTQQQIRAYFQAQRARLELALLTMLQAVGERFIASARSTNTYKDQTGNLRASIGYVILQNKRVVFESFPGGTSEGIAKAQALVKRLMRAGLQNEIGFAIICVAGMDYAAAVEAKGFDVITSSSLAAKNDLESGLARIKEKMMRGAA